MGGDGRNPLYARLDRRRCWAWKRSARRRRNSARSRSRASRCAGASKTSTSTAERIKELGFEGVLRPIKVSCADHEGARTARIQTWDGKNWKITSDWYVSDDNVIVPMVKEAAAEITRPKRRSRRVSGDEQMRDRSTAAAIRRGQRRFARVLRLQGTGRGHPILSVNNVEVVYDHVILVLKGVSLAVPQGRDRGPLGREWRWKIDDAESDFQFAVGRARRGDQGVHRLRW